MTVNSIKNDIEKRNIREVLHFSTNLGFLGSLHMNWLLPRNKLREEDQLSHILTLNAPFRAEEKSGFDKSQNWINYVNLSISEITINLFKHSLKWHEGADVYWLIMAFDTEILRHDGVYFSTTNSIYPLTQRSEGLAGFRALFKESVSRKPGWTVSRNDRELHLPTCEQAEVLYPGGVPMTHLRRVYVRLGEDADRAHALLSHSQREDVEVVVNSDKFTGRPN